MLRFPAPGAQLVILTVLPLRAQAPPEKQVNYNPLFGSVVPRGVPYRPLTGRERLHLYAAGSFGNWGIGLRAFLPAAFDHATGSPAERAGARGASGAGRPIALAGLR